ncbi:DUF2182 domain-containing protein [Pontixanthobacter luteolus]|uniref:copper chaperone n=1 Tax=Pontixanthobacter luteolus TaxID=295089 RepID=UPI002303EE77|nr:DUF2182 domain-containing protein [Pontixanthobacter luteolus]
MIAFLNRLFRQNVYRFLILSSAAMFLAVNWLPAPVKIASLCGDSTIMLGVRSGISNLQLFPLSNFAEGWFFMMVPMMLVLLASPLQHVWQSAVKAWRLRAAVVFLGAYLGAWMAAGAVVIPLSVLTRSVFGEGAALAAVLAFAFLWSASPISQRARNRCHKIRRISACGAAMARDCVSYGLRHAAACIASCWPWMLVPMAAEDLHLAAMTAVTVYLFFERIAPTRSPRWRLPPGLTLPAELVRMDLMRLTRQPSPA